MQEKGFLAAKILTAQDRFKAYLDYFKIKYTCGEERNLKLYEKENIIALQELG